MLKLKGPESNLCNTEIVT